MKSSTRIPNLICDLLWVPFRIAEWLTRGFWQLMGWTLAIAFAFIFAVILFSFQFMSWLESGIGITVLVCVVIAGWACFREDWSRM